MPPPTTVVPLTKDKGGPRLAFYTGMGVRYADQEWRRTLNRLIQENQPEISRLLLSYGVPLLDDNDQRITGATLAALGLGVLGVAAWWVYRKLRHLRHHWRYTRPLRRRLARHCRLRRG